MTLFSVLHVCFQTNFEIQIHIQPVRFFPMAATTSTTIPSKQAIPAGGFVASLKMVFLRNPFSYRPKDLDRFNEIYVNKIFHIASLFGVSCNN